ncbi:MAG: hypothetical protein CMQ38_05825 [Gammaproteobacteria bacterium]|nr:hypothetical protein [Gammaproteobacteria bacterium]|tara:strand:+ start:36 stop:269 length:234 start_codon:yes stop_codon:yes gene_type:complete
MDFSQVADFAKSRGVVSISSVQRRFKVNCRQARDVLEGLVERGILESDASAGWSFYKPITGNKKKTIIQVIEYIENP